MLGPAEVHHGLLQMGLTQQGWRSMAFWAASSLAALQARCLLAHKNQGCAPAGAERDELRPQEMRIELPPMFCAAVAHVRGPRLGQARG